jgi:hypothetical protein
MRQRRYLEAAKRRCSDGQKSSGNPEMTNDDQKPNELYNSTMGILAFLVSFCVFGLSHAYLFLVSLQINELKKKHQEGGRAVYTWQKHSSDKYVTGLGVTLISLGFLQLIPTYYRLATGKGKME